MFEILGDVQIGTLEAGASAEVVDEDRFRCIKVTISLPKKSETTLRYDKFALFHSGTDPS